MPETLLITHDPKQIIEVFRSHLGDPSRPLAFLFGAGTSSSINVAPPAGPGEKRQHRPLIPSMIPLTEICRAAVEKRGEQFAEAWKLLEAECEKPNIERILSRVVAKLDAIGSNETLAKLTKSELEAVEKVVRETIAGVAIPIENAIPSAIPHDAFASWLRRSDRTAPIEIFTTNYDVLIERSMELSGIPFFDGFIGSYQPCFHADAVDRDDLIPQLTWVRLWKIHGSVNWKREDRQGGHRVIRATPHGSGEMIFPSSRKYDESRKQPFMALLDRFASFLNRPHALLIVCGYGFGDDHINALISSALDSRATVNVIALRHSELKQDNWLVSWAAKRRNLMLLGPNGAVISGRWGAWRLNEVVDQRTHGYMDIAFDSNASVPPEPPEGKVCEYGDNTTGALGGASSPPQSAPEQGPFQGRLRLGDFNWLCKFLHAMEREDPHSK